MIDTDSIQYVIQYVVSIVASFLLLGMGAILVCTKYNTKKSIFYTKMLKQWIPSVLFLFLLIVIARLLICYFYFPIVFTSAFILPFYIFLVILGTILLCILYVHSKKNSPSSCLMYIATFIITSFSELLILFFIANTFYSGHIPYDEILQPTFFLFLTRVIPYSFVLSSLVYTLITISRRDKDTFGRDYYIFTLQYCTKISYISTLILALLSLSNGIVLIKLLTTTLSFSFLFVIVFLMPALIFLYVFFMLRRIYASKINPLQYKVTFIIALILILVALSIDVISVQPYLL